MSFDEKLKKASYNFVEFAPKADKEKIRNSYFKGGKFAERLAKKTLSWFVYRTGEEFDSILATSEAEAKDAICILLFGDPHPRESSQRKLAYTCREMFDDRCSEPWRDSGNQFQVDVKDGGVTCIRICKA